MFLISQITVNSENQIISAKGPNLHIDFGPRYSFVRYQDESHHHSKLIETRTLLRSLGDFNGEAVYVH